MNVPPLRGGPGVDILFSPGMPVTWSQFEVGDAASNADEPSDDAGDYGL